MRSRIALLLLPVLAFAGCGGDDDDDTGASTPATTPTAQEQPASDGPVIGIGEQNAGMFAAPAFKGLNVEHVRLVVSYDATKVKFERELVDAWLKGAEQDGAEPFVTFGHSRVKPKKLPTAEEYRSAVQAFRKRYPQVKVFAAWNEINHNSQPTYKNPKRAAEYYNVLAEECSDCTVLAGDVLDQPGMVSYVRRYKKALKGEPTTWGLHNYADANRFRTGGLDDLIKEVKGDIWLTETGGLVEFGRNFPRDEKRADKAVKYVLDLAAKTKRVKRVYLYNWTGTEPGARFDAGLVGPDGQTPRPAYATVKKALE